MLAINERFSLLCAFVTFLALPAAADDAEQFDFREQVLDNGLRIVALEDFSCPIVAVHLWYHVGSKDEDPERTGFAHMFEHMMFRGTERLGPKEHFDYVRRTGGNCNAYTSFDQTVYVQTLPANQLELALWLEAERMAFLKIDQESFDTERKVVEEERRLFVNRPYGTVPEKLLPQILEKHPYRWLPIGNIAHLRAASVQELRAFWTTNYVPNNATLVVVGAVEHEEIFRLAQKYFGWIPRYAQPPRVDVVEPPQTKARTLTIKADNAPTPVVGVLYRTVPQRHDDYVALQMLGRILGGDDSSRLYRKLVAEDELAMMALAAAFSLEQDGAIAAGAVLPPVGGSPKKAIVAINDEIKRLRAEPVSERELEKARNQMLKQIVTGALTVESKARLLGAAAVLEGDTSRVNRRLEAIRSVTADDLLAVAQKYMAPQRAIRLKIDRNLMGMLFSKKNNAEEDAPITAQPEKQTPPPGRGDVARPKWFAAEPPVAAVKEPKLAYESTERMLANGLKVIVVPNHEVPYVSVRLGLMAGAWTEDQPGAAAMTMSMLTKGTEQHSEGELAEELATYAISLAGSGGMDTAGVTAGCLAEQLERAIPLLAEVVRTPTFPQDEFGKLKKQTLTGLTISSAQPTYVADREFRRRVYGAHPYARTATGETDDVKALTVDHLKQWWSRFVRPDMAALIIAGDVEPERALQFAEAAFGDWTASGPKPETKLPEISPPAPTHIYLVDRPGPQSQIRVGHIGFTREHPDYFVSRVVGNYFGGGFNSRLNETIRVEKGLTYGARGGFSAQRFAGQFRVSTFSKTATTVEAVAAIFGELDRLLDEPPSAEELGDTKSYTLGGFPARRETPQQLASHLWLLVSHGLPADYSARMLEAVSRTQAEDCIRLARQTVDASRMVVVVVGSAEQLEDELARIAPVTIVNPGEPPARSERAAAREGS